MIRYQPIGPRRTAPPGPPPKFLRALTIQPPYASLIVGWPGWDLALRKRVENRNWRNPPAWRGDFLIHQGASRDWLHTWQGATPAEMPFGAIVGIARLVAVVDHDHVNGPDCNPALAWLRTDRHWSGPVGLVLDWVRRFHEPIPAAGQQGWWNVKITPRLTESIDLGTRLPVWSLCSAF